jgi:hypothetical protein
MAELAAAAAQADQEEPAEWVALEAHTAAAVSRMMVAMARAAAVEEMVAAADTVAAVQGAHLSVSFAPVDRYRN